MRLACWFRRRAETVFLFNFPPITREELQQKFAIARTRSPARETRALPYTRERRRPVLREYFTGLRFGSILSIPAPLFTSII